MYVVTPVGFYDVERNLSALDLTRLNLAYTRGCKAKVHVQRGDPDMHLRFYKFTNRRSFSWMSSRSADKLGARPDKSFCCDDMCRASEALRLPEEPNADHKQRLCSPLPLSISTVQRGTCCCRHLNQSHCWLSHQVENAGGWLQFDRVETLSENNFTFTQI